MSSGSRKGADGANIATVTQKTQWPVNWQGDKPEPNEPTLRGKMRRPRDPRKAKRTSIRPPRRNPMMGRVEPRKETRVLMYEHDDDTFEEEEE